jgi:alkylation response protein AidB-like acyl-CoA dehydrogenase
VDLELNDEHLELREAAVGILDRHAPLSLARSFLDGSGDAAQLWREIAELGWLGVGLEDDDPFGVPGLCLLAEQVGRRAAPTTLVDTTFAARVARAAGSEWGERLAGGDPSMSLAMLEPGGSWSASGIAASARRNGSEFVLAGHKAGVHHAGTVEMFAVIAELDGGLALALVEPGCAGVTVTPHAGLDPSCAPGRVVLCDVSVPESAVFAGPVVAAELAHALDIAAVATTAEGLGAAGTALELAVAYSLEREQYGRPIAGFQALRHLIAEQHVERETAWAAVLYAAAALEERIDGAAAAAAVAKAHGATATKSIVEGSLQVLGGVGFTREHDLHLLYRRALECAGRFGGADEHERRVADALLSPEPALAG